MKKTLSILTIFGALFLSGYAHSADVNIGSTGYSFNTEGVKASYIIDKDNKNYSPTEFYGTDSAYLETNRVLYWEYDMGMNKDYRFFYDDPIVNRDGADAVLLVNSPSVLQGRAHTVKINGVQKEIFPNIRVIRLRTNTGLRHPGIYAGLIDLTDFGVAEGSSINSMQVLASMQNTSVNYNAWRSNPSAVSEKYGNYSDTFISGIGPINSSEINIGNRIWLDENKNGLQDADENTGIENVTVELKDLNFRSLQTTKTDANGEYNFKTVAGTYILCVDSQSIADNYRVTLLNKGNNDLIDSDFTGQFYCLRNALRATKDDFSFDLGLFSIDDGPVIAPPKTGNRYIGNRVFLDANRDGLHQVRRERGVAGVRVQLFNQRDELVKTAVSGGQGYYHFRSLPADKYYLKYDLSTLPRGFEITKHTPTRAAASNGSDNDANDEGFTGVIDLTNTRSTQRVDMGVRKIIN